MLGSEQLGTGFLLPCPTQALRSRWPWLLAFGVFAGVVYTSLGFWWHRGVGKRPLTAFTGIAIVTAVGLWGMLFVHNVAYLGPYDGFDAANHLQYVEYIQATKTLPLADDGPQMFQAPLSYLLWAVILGMLGLGPFDESGLVVIRLLNLVAGVAQFMLVFASARLLFPEHPRRSLIALMLAAFTPVNLYVYQFVTNEGLLGTLVTLALYLTLT